MFKIGDIVRVKVMNQLREGPIMDIKDGRYFVQIDVRTLYSPPIEDPTIELVASSPEKWALLGGGKVS